MKRLVPRVGLRHRLYAVALCLTVTSLAVALNAYVPVRRAAQQVEAARVDITSTLAVDALGRHSGIWLWEVSTALLAAPDGDASLPRASHDTAADALRTWIDNERGEEDLAAAKAVETSFAAVERVIAGVEPMFDRGDHVEAIGAFTSDAARIAMEDFGIPLEGDIRREHDEMREAFVRLAGDASTGGPFAQHLTGRVLAATAEAERGIAASAFIRSRVLQGHLLALTLLNPSTVPIEILPVMGKLASNQLQSVVTSMVGANADDSWGPRAAGELVKGDVGIDRAANAVVKLMARGEIETARGLFLDELQPAITAEIKGIDELLDEKELAVFEQTSLVISEGRGIAIATSAFALVLLILALVSAATARRVARRIARTTDAVRSMGSDDSPVQLVIEGRDELSLLAEAFNTMTTRLTESRERERHLVEGTVNAAEVERLQLAAELHDGPIQRLTGVLYGLERVKSRIARGANGAADLVAEACTDVSAEVGALRHMLSELRPPVLEERGIGPAIRDYLSQFSTDSGIVCDIDVRTDERMEAMLETTIYRVLQESLSNVRKHARATHVSVAIWVDDADDADVRLLISDDGAGFDLANASSSGGGDHFGLFAMRERVRIAGGEFTVESAPGAGTRLYATFPRLMREAA